MTLWQITANYTCFIEQFQQQKTFLNKTCFDLNPHFLESLLCQQCCLWVAATDDGLWIILSLTHKASNWYDSKHRRVSGKDCRAEKVVRDHRSRNHGGISESTTQSVCLSDTWWQFENKNDTEEKETHKLSPLKWVVGPCLVSIPHHQPPRYCCCCRCWRDARL